MKRQRIELRWSRRENDWWFTAPDREGMSMAGVLFDMVKTTGHRVDWQEDLKKMLADKGYDYRTLEITCKKLPKTNLP